MIVEAIASAVTAIAAFGTFCVAFRGLRAWRHEMIGRRKAEIAEEVLADFYRERDMIASLRSPLAFTHEKASRVRDPDESENLSKRLDTVYVSLDRLKKEEAFLAAFQAKRYRFQAIFDETAATSFEEIFQVVKKIAIAATMLQDAAREAEMGTDVDIALRREHENAIWGTNDDELARKVDEAVARIEQTCRPAIEARENRR